MTELSTLIERVIEARKIAGEAQDALSTLRKQWEIENQGAIAKATEAVELLTTEENLLRESALVAYAATGQKQVAPGVVIRVNHMVAYLREAAEQWSQEHGGIAHVFDAKTFERLVQAGQEGGIALIKDVPTATLAKILEKE